MSIASLTNNLNLFIGSKLAPSSAKKAPTKAFAVVIAFKIVVQYCTKPLTAILKTPSPSSIDNSKPSQADFNLVVSPAKLSSLTSAIAAAAPSAFLNDSVSLSISFLFPAKTSKALPPISPTSSVAVTIVLELAFILSNASFNVIPFFSNSRNALAKPVPAFPPLILALARTPSIAEVSCIVFPVDLAVGAAFFNASCKSEKLKALSLVLAAKTSTTV